MTRRHALLCALLATAVILGLAATRRDFGRPNRVLFSEMARSPAYRSQSPKPVFSDGRLPTRPASGTVSRQARPIDYSTSDGERRLAIQESVNPFPESLEVLLRGRASFRAFCSHCHGTTGDGDGNVALAFSSFSMQISGAATKELSDGALFLIISDGRNNMPAHASQIARADRWKIVHYLRDL